jgi:hypothetical protein
MTATFGCGHPRSPENSIAATTVRKCDGSRPYTVCRFCNRVRNMRIVAERRQQRINAGLPVDRRTIGSAAVPWL